MLRSHRATLNSGRARTVRGVVAIPSEPNLSDVTGEYRLWGDLSSGDASDYAVITLFWSVCLPLCCLLIDRHPRLRLSPTAIGVDLHLKLSRFVVYIEVRL